MEEPENIAPEPAAKPRLKGLFPRAITAIFAVALGYVFVEFTWNANAFTMNPYYIGANLLFLAVIFAVIHLLGQLSRASIVAFWALCLLMGIANYYVVSFKGQPVVPADLFALNTAAAVSEGYSYAPSWRMVTSIVIFVAASIALTRVPKLKLTRKVVLASTLSGALVLGGFCLYISKGDIEEDFDCIVGQWYTLSYYENQGTTLCFLKRVQDLMPDKPAGYSAYRVDEILSGANSGGAENEAAEGEIAESPATDVVQPNVIIVMNETFSDISQYESLAGTAAYPGNYYRIAQEALTSGTAYVSCFGAGTCNSEFEVLTGACMGNLGEDVYPYVLYDLAGNENLASYFKSFGYDATAMHPADMQNWRRDRVYAQLGFDTFMSAGSFSDAEKLRWFTIDRATYDAALNLVSESDTPQFILDVTIQNHGGYNTGAIPEEYAVSAPVNGVEYGCVNEFAALIQRSDADLAYFIEQLEALDEPVIVLFFGDHQPSLADVPEEELYGVTLEEASLEQTQERYEVPYMIWANYEVAAESASEAAKATALAEVEEGNAEAMAKSSNVSSLNYLGMQLVEYTSLPLTSYQRFLLNLQGKIPAINLHGFMTEDGTWHAFEELDGDTISPELAELLQDYAAVQYGNLFDTSAGKEIFVR